MDTPPVMKVKEPFLYCKFLVERPWLAFGLTLGGHFLMVAINLILFGTGYDILPVEFQAFPLELRGDVTYQREVAWELRNQGSDRIRRSVVNHTGPYWQQGVAIDNIELYYRPVRGENIFIKPAFEEMEILEKRVFHLESYRKTYCQLDGPTGSASCVKPRSILRFFDGTYAHIDPVFNDPRFNNITNVLYAANTSVYTRGELQFFLGRGSSITKNRAFSEVTRTQIPIGWPIPGNGTNKQKAEQLDEFLQNPIKPLLNSLRDQTREVRLNYITTRLFVYDVQRQAFLDMFLAIGSLCFVFLFIWIATGSLWVTGWAVLSIITSFWAANLVYRIVLDFRYFGYFHIISIFIILGIGADDIFVFFNTWKASAFEEYASLSHRLSECYRRAAGTMFYTSLTTACAFFASASSPLLPLYSFGVFSGVLVLVNYISVIVFFPTVLITYHYTFEEYTPPCCRPCKRQKPVDVIDTSAHDNKDGVFIPTKKKNPIVRFFKGPYYRLVTHKVGRWIIIALFLGVIAVFAWSATRIDVDTDEVRIYRPETNYGTAWDLNANGFLPSGDNFVRILIVWGMYPRDFSVCHFTDHRCQGAQRVDDGFDMNPPPAQLALDAFCHMMKFNLSDAMIDDLMIRRDGLTNQLEVECFMTNMADYMKRREPEVSSTLGMNVSLSYPLTETNMLQFMVANDPLIYNVSGLNPAFHRYFEVALSHWMTQGYTMFVSDDYITFNNLLGEVRDDPYTRDIKPFGRAGSYGTKLHYAAIRVNLTQTTLGLNYVTGLPLMEKWDKFVQDQVSTMPYQLKNAFQTTAGTWHFLKVQQSLVYNALFGIVLGLVIALCVLILATRNLITGPLATLTLCCTTLCVMGVLPFAGWRLEIMVSMNLSLVVGLSVDYVVHFAEGYHLATASDRKERTKDMLEHLGISVLLGAVTTLGSAFFMLFAKIQFFLQFGTFLFCSIGFSLVFSLGIFTTLLAIIGPQEEFGSIVPAFRWIKHKIQGRAKVDVECKRCDGRGFVKPKEKDENQGDSLHMNGFIGPCDEMTVNAEDLKTIHL